VTRTIQNYENELAQNERMTVFVKHEALPFEIADCVYPETTSLVLIAHAAEIDSDESALVYFRRLRGSERKAKISETRRALIHETTLMASDARREKAQYDNCSGGGNKRPCPPLGRTYLRWKQMQEYLKKMDSLSLDAPIYSSPKPFLEIAFRRLQDKLRQFKEDNREVNLRSIHIAACEPDKVRVHYPILNELEAEFGLNLEFAPPTPVWSFFLGKKVVNFNRSWLEQSLSLREDSASSLNQITN
ncbi:hypothetical protein EBR96_07875, partial [bacterium]|nr:hypothetical protein [bacterium]